MIHTGFAFGAVAVYALTKVAPCTLLPPERIVNGEIVGQVDRIRYVVTDLRNDLKNSLQPESWHVVTEILQNHLWQALTIRSFMGVQEERTMTKETAFIAALSASLFVANLACTKIFKKRS